ncbi:cell wall hydrolase [Tepidibacillus sp. HK-1]|uniref:cell wall hydrolase n=1 Tax=Tepidibacillus sp. HK-1 TaxID=1883407 RepID=UPI000852F6E0|nr:cell wall hydrolase [Tepidibacillus sp. HK-1]GBF12414.1 spore cortex-lytic enzyme precursor [Tepidibacillus sp. HK-1]
MKKQISLIVLFLIISLFVGVQADASSIQLKINGKLIDQPDARLIDKRTYVPVRKISEFLGAELNWDSDLQQVTFTQENHMIQFKIGERFATRDQQKILMDAPAIILNNATYVPIRFVSEALFYNVDWDNTTKTVYISEKITYNVQEGDTLASIGQVFGIPVKDLKAWNQIADENNLPVGSKIYLESVEVTTVDQLKAKAVISFQDEELEWLAKIIYLEAGNEPYEGQVAVGAVIINRVLEDSFANSIYDVIFAKGQFTPVRTGEIYKVTPSDSAYKAAREALEGVDPVEGALYFYNPKVTKSSFFTQKKVIKTIGNHRFVR